MADQTNGVVSNAFLANRVQSAVDDFDRFALEVNDWVGGAANGGPYSDGRYPVSNSANVISYIPSPARLASMVEGPSANAVAALDAVYEIRALASDFANSASDDAGAAALSRVAAETAAAVAENSKNFAGGYAANAAYWFTQTEAIGNSTVVANAAAHAIGALVLAANTFVAVANVSVHDVLTLTLNAQHAAEAARDGALSNTAAISNAAGIVLPARDQTLQYKLDAANSAVLSNASAVTAKGHADRSQVNADLSNAAVLANTNAQIANGSAWVAKAGAEAARDGAVANTAAISNAAAVVLPMRDAAIQAKLDAANSAVDAEANAILAATYASYAANAVAADANAQIANTHAWEGAHSVDATYSLIQSVNAAVNAARLVAEAAAANAVTANSIANRVQLSLSVTATGSSQTVDLGQDVAAAEILIFQNGIEQNATDFTKNTGTTWTFTRPAGTKVRFMVPGGVRGRAFAPDATGALAGRSAYDGEGEGFTYLDTSAGAFYFKATTGWDGPVFIKGDKGDTGDTGATGAAGSNGWVPTLAVVADGARSVQQVVDWTGGTGTKPTTGLYVGASGFVTPIANAVDIRGATGATGANGTNGTNGANGVSAVYSSIPPVALAPTANAGTLAEAARGDHAHQFPLARISNAVTANATLTLADHGGVVEWGAATNGTLTLPNSLPQGFNCLVRVTSSTSIPTFTAASGAAIRQADSLTKARKQWSEVSVSVRANANGAVAEYVLSGDMS